MSFVKFFSYGNQALVFSFNKENPLTEIENILSNRTFNADIKYFGIYITPFSKILRMPIKGDVLL